MREEIIHKEVSHRILGAAMSVLNELKPGLDEKLCENAIVVELRSSGFQVDQQNDTLFTTKPIWLGRWFLI